MDDSGCGSSESYALRVLGDSMEPEFQDGCIVIVDPAGVIEDGAYVVAMHEGEYIFRQLGIREGRYHLRALNSGYPELEIPGLSAVAGVVVQRAGTRRSEHKHYA
jgi:SOS-response transcriptional repressor LexA